MLSAAKGPRHNFTVCNVVVDDVRRWMMYFSKSVPTSDNTGLSVVRARKHCYTYRTIERLHNHRLVYLTCREKCD